MSAELTKIEKKLTQLKANKEKEEKRLKDSLDKLTVKYNEDQKNLKATFDGKVAEAKKEASIRIGTITPEIEFYEKQHREISKLEAQMEQLRRGLNDRLSAGKTSASAQEERAEETEAEVVEDAGVPEEAAEYQDADDFRVEQY